MIMQKNQGKGSAAGEIRPEHDLRGGVRGKYYERYKQGTNVVLLEPDIAKVFRDSATVNKALRQNAPRPKRRLANQQLEPTARLIEKRSAPRLMPDVGSTKMIDSGRIQDEVEGLS